MAHADTRAHPHQRILWQLKRQQCHCAGFVGAFCLFACSCHCHNNVYATIRDEGGGCRLWRLIYTTFLQTTIYGGFISELAAVRGASTGIVHFYSDDLALCTA